MFVLDRTNIDKALDEIEQEVYERGNKAGLEQGLEQGRLEESHRLLERLLSRKFGENDAREERIARLDTDAVEDAVELIFDVENEPDFWAAVEASTNSR
jgi:flagellar biosynthesis/type III secretory pathway protein FliH